jgi:probable DNA repair protein
MNAFADFHQRILAAAASGALVVTVNKRLCRHLRERFDAEQRGAGRSVWATPAIHSLDGYLLTALGQAGEDWRLLGEFAARRLWEEVIAADAARCGVGLLQVPATARQALAAHALLVEYGAAWDASDLTEDHAAFARWRSRYRDACRQGEWLDPAQLCDAVAALAAEGRIDLPQELLLVGFDEISPRLQRLSLAFTRQGVRVVEVPAPTAPAGELRRLPCADRQQEVRRTARWARACMEEGAERIGVIVPDLARYRTLVERTFQAEIDPEALVHPDREGTRFSLSLGAPLAGEGLAAAALAILSLGFRISADEAGLLLRSPYLEGAQSELFARARLERLLRSERRTELSPSGLIRLAGEGRGRWEAGRSPRFAALFGQLAARLKDSRPRKPGEWAKTFAATLRDAGWPGERSLSSREYQAYRLWQEELLPALASLDAVSGPLERSTALALLRRRAAETVFQPESPDGPLQVVGLLEAAGLEFDRLWVMGFAEDALPAPARPNPFVPLGLQAAHDMPHSSAERELSFARQLFARLCAAAPSVVFSHPEREGDCPLRPSPFVAALPVAALPETTGHDPVEALRRSAVLLEAFVDEQGPPLPAGEVVAGGTAILKDQALCPFRAFAHHRLTVAALDRPDIGLDAGTRGTLLHRSLEAFWRETGDQRTLLGLPEDELRRRTVAAVDAAVESCFGSGRLRPAESLLALERERLIVLLLDWFDSAERERPPFSVAETEQGRSARFGALEIRTQVDRIDILENGNRLILDYKTGRPDPKDLDAERLLEPQLPIYAVGAVPQPAGVAFARVRRGECAFLGVAQDAGILPGVAVSAAPEEWPALLERWRLRLEELAASFGAGHAAVAPVDPLKACRYCDLSPLCRIDEIATYSPEDA